MLNRNALFVSTLLAGLALAVLGVAFSAPIGTPDSPAISNPKVEFAPLMFVIGVTVIFASAVVYELVPDKWSE